ncbi:hypothetical protein AAVH_10763 [Aphelenchoides avenae]|nr:hypothetical protein AAVH_10763 [Aphelenchus avenae]
MTTRPSAVWDYFKKLPDAMLCEFALTEANVQYSDSICRLIADRMRNEDASEAVCDAECTGADDDDYEEMMLKKRKIEKRLSSQNRTP